MHRQQYAKKQYERWLPAALMLVGALVRLWGLGLYPGGINQDEAYAAYEAYSLLESGMDSWGYRFPVYLTVWGSGMSALQSYLMIPFIALFGLETWVIRLPQALLACAALPAMYALLQTLFDRRTALVGLSFLAICPWHITMARWGLDCNYAPGLVLMGLLFFEKGTEKPQFYLLSGFLYGLSLYAYAMVWPVLPFMIALHALYLAYVRRLRLSGWLVLGALVLGGLALPLIVFLLVNWGMIGEIRTPLFSIPQMPQMRAGEVSFSNLYENTYRMVKTFLLQRDDMVWNASDEFGLYYHISLPFMILGGVICLVRSIQSVKARKKDGCVPVLIWLLLGVLQGLTVDGNVNRLNFLHFPLILLAVIGLAGACAWMKRRWRIFAPALAALYGASFLLFICFYLTDYQQKIAEAYDAGLEEALTYAQSICAEEETIYVSDAIAYPKILFYARENPDDFRAGARWRGEPSAFMQLESAGRYAFVSDVAEAGVYVLKASRPAPGTEANVFHQIAVVRVADPK